MIVIEFCSSDCIYFCNVDFCNLEGFTVPSFLEQDLDDSVTHCKIIKTILNDMSQTSDKLEQKDDEGDRGSHSSSRPSSAQSRNSSVLNIVLERLDTLSKEQRLMVERQSEEQRLLVERQTEQSRTLLQRQEESLERLEGRLSVLEMQVDQQQEITNLVGDELGYRPTVTSDEQSVTSFHPPASETFLIGNPLERLEGSTTQMGRRRS